MTREGTVLLEKQHGKEYIWAVFSCSVCNRGRFCPVKQCLPTKVCLKLLTFKKVLKIDSFVDVQMFDDFLALYNGCWKFPMHRFVNWLWCKKPKSEFFTSKCYLYQKLRTFFFASRHFWLQVCTAAKVLTYSTFCPRWLFLRQINKHRRIAQTCSPSQIRTNHDCSFGGMLRFIWLQSHAVL